MISSPSAQGPSGATGVGQAQQRLSAATTEPTVSGSRSATARHSSTHEPGKPPRLLLVDRARMIAFADGCGLSGGGIVAFSAAGS